MCATQTFATGWVPQIPGLTDPIPEIASYLSELPDAQHRSAVITAANWGGTYASAVLSPYTEIDADASAGKSASAVPR